MRARIAFRPLRIISKFGEFSITPREADVLFCLMAHRMISVSQIIEFFYGDQEDGGPLFARNCVKRWICELRKNLRGAGWSIQTRDRGFYSLEEVGDGKEI